MGRKETIQDVGGGIICLNFALIALLTYIGANILAPHTVASIVNNAGMLYAPLSLVHINTHT
jgi:hypothetical protein